MIHQLRYRFKKPPKAKDIERARADWIAGRPTPGVKLEPIYWGRDELDTRAAAAAGWIGKAGLVKCYARPNRTMCDYDEPAPAADLYHVYRLARMLGIRPVLVRYDRTAHGWHLIVEWSRTFRPAEIVAIQAILGSDSKRELFNMARVLSGKARSPRWNLLFERKLTKGGRHGEKG